MKSTILRSASFLFTLLALAGGLAPLAHATLVIWSADCAAQADNMLRYDCPVTTLSPAQVWIEFEEAGSGEIHTTETTASGTSHELTLWGLKPSSHYDVTIYARPIMGPADTRLRPFTTDALPSVPFASVSTTSAVAGLDFGSYWGFVPLAETRFALLKGDCNSSSFLYIVDIDGNIVWYQDVSTVGATSIDGFTFTDRNTVAAILGRTQLVEWSLAGEVIKNWNYGAELTRLIHHDLVFKRNKIYVLTAEPITAADGTDWVSDGVQVFDHAGNRLRQWRLSDVYDPRSYDCPESGGGYWNRDLPGYTDWGHANSLWVDRYENWYVSLRACHQVLKIVGAPLIVNFGSVDWTLGGDSTDPYGDFVVTSSETTNLDFRGQHHAWLEPNGDLRMFDNYGAGDARALLFELDEATGTADITEERDLARSCSTQGSAYRVGENVVAACVAEGLAVEMSSVWGEVWRLEAECGGSPMGMYRAIPIEDLEP